MDAESAKEELLKVLQGIDDEEKAVKVALQACASVVRSSLLRSQTAKWFERTSGSEVTEESDPKFGDGIDKATGANKPSEILKLKYYPSDYSAYGGKLDAAGQNALFASIAEWSYPTHTLWGPETMTDLKANADVVVSHHSFNQQPEIVLPMYLYSASQKGYPFVWVYWSPEGKWVKPRDPQAIEKEFQRARRGAMSLQQDWFCTKGCAAEVQVPKEVTMEQYSGTDPEAYQVHGFWGVAKTFFGTHKVRIIRFAVPGKGDPMQSPLYDTVAWLPAPQEASEAMAFEADLKDLPPPGVVEYLYSRGATEDISWVEEAKGGGADAGWRSAYAFSKVGEFFVDTLFSEPNQQEYNSGLHADYKAFVNMLCTDSVEDRFIRLVASCAARMNTDESKSIEVTLDLYSQFQHQMRTLKDTGIELDAVRDLLAFKLGGNNEPPPGLIAHALEVQHLRYGDRHFLLALSGARPCVLHANRVISLHRNTLTFDDQIFWQLNYTMRMVQWNAHSKLHINGDGPLAGKYWYSDDSKTFVRKEDKATALPQTQQANVWKVDVAGTVHDAGSDIWFEAATWLAEAIKPLMYFIDKALFLAVQATDLEGTSGGGEAVKTYRGLKNVALPRDVYSEDKVVLWGAYSSTSGDRGVATSFAGEDTKVAVFSLVGTNPVCISRWSRFGREREWLYPANSQFQVTSSLSEDQQELLGKKNLQIFSMKEVDEKNSVLQYLRTLVNFVIQTEKAALMPRHVSQIFKVMQAIEDENYSLALRACCDPTELVVSSGPGVDIAHLLQTMDPQGTQNVITQLARYDAGAYPSRLVNLVQCGVVNGLSFDDAFTWLTFFEANDRRALEQMLLAEKDECRARLDVVLGEIQEGLAFLSKLSDMQLSGLERVMVKGLKGPALHLNGLYCKGVASDRIGERLEFHQFNPTRMNANAQIHFDDRRNVWRLSDLTMRNQDGTDKLEGFSPINGTLLTWGEGLEWKQDPFLTTTHRIAYKCGVPVVSAVRNDSAEGFRYNAGAFASAPAVDGKEMYPGDFTWRELEAELDEGCEDGEPTLPMAKLKLIPGTQSKIQTEDLRVYLNTEVEGAGEEQDGGATFAFESVVGLLSVNLEDEAADEEDTELIAQLSEKYSAQHLKAVASEQSFYKRKAETERRKLTEDQKRAMDDRFKEQYDRKRHAASRGVYPEEEPDDYFRKYLRVESFTMDVFHERWVSALRTGESQLEDMASGRITADQSKIDAAFARREKCHAIHDAYVNNPLNAEAIAHKKFERTPLTGIIHEERGWLNDILKGYSAAGQESGILTICCGQSGCQVGEALWEVYKAEHDQTLGDRNVLYAEKSDGRHVPRGVFVDSDPDPPMCALKRLGNTQDFSHEDFITGRDSCNTYATGVSSKALVDQTLEAIRRQVEQCDYLHGFQVHHNAGGGVGSGVTSKLLEEMSRHYSKSMVHSFCLYPSGTLASPVEPYNALLLSSSLLEYSSVTTYYTNEACYGLLSGDTMCVPSPVYKNVNRLVARVAAAFTCCTRYPSYSTRVDMRCLITNLVPYPRMNQTVPSFAPCLSRYVPAQEVTCATMAHAVTSSSLASITLREGRMLGSCMVFRGDVSEGVANVSGRKVSDKMNKCEWQPGGLKMGVSTAAPAYPDDSDFQKTGKDVAMLSNTSAVTQMTQRVGDQQLKLYAKRAFVHHFVAEGMEEGEFSECLENMAALQKDYEEVTADADEDDEDDDYD